MYRHKHKKKEENPCIGPVFTVKILINKSYKNTHRDVMTVKKAQNAHSLGRQFVHFPLNVANFQPDKPFPYTAFGNDTICKKDPVVFVDITRATLHLSLRTITKLYDCIKAKFKLACAKNN